MHQLTGGRYSIKTVCFSRNFGKEAALVAAIERCQKGAIVFLDSDGQHPPEILPEFVRRWKEEGNDVVYAVHHKRQDHPIKQKLVGLFYRFINAGSSIEIPPNAADYKLLSPRALEALKACKERIRFFKGLSTWIGFKQSAIEYEPEERISGTTKWNMLRLLNLSSEGVISFSTAPLRATIFLGVGFAIPAMLYGFWIVFSALLLGNDVSVYAFLFTATVFMGGLQLMLLGLVGEYVGHMMREIKQRPIYIIAEESSQKAKTSEASDALGADDYAYTSEISESILWLLENDKIQGTSCMVVTQAWPKDVAALKDLSKRRPDIQIGLHITLTGDWLKPSAPASKWQAFPKMPVLLLKSHLHLLDGDLIENEIASQIAKFRRDFGRLPDFVDGHEHVHLFPQIRKACNRLCTPLVLKDGSVNVAVLSKGF